jgi:nucleotide-binding universal stress UspA family protein
MGQMTSGIHAIMHPTDFSELSHHAFVHALKLALVVRSKLYLVHVADRGNEDPWHAFPHVRETLAEWGLFNATEPPEALASKLGIQVVKVEVEPQDPVRGLSHFLAGHPSDLMVLATHGREGLPRWWRPSIAEAMSRRSSTRTLFISAQSRGFVDPAHGDIGLTRILIPLDHHPPPAAALRAAQEFSLALDLDPAVRLIHVGAAPPSLAASEARFLGAVELHSGNVVDAILQTAVEGEADLIVMATAGHDSLLDAARGSTVERVIRHAPCPVLAVPVIHSR